MILARTALEFVQHLVPRLLALAVFSMAAGPGLCALACEITACPSSQANETPKSCCHPDETKPDSCCVQMAKVTSADLEKASPTQFVLQDIQALPPQPVTATGAEKTNEPDLAYGHNERAPPGPTLKTASPRGPPVPCA